MKKKYFVFLISLVLLILNAQPVRALPPRLIQSIPLPDVEGRIDHLSIDIQGQRLFVAALGNNTVEVVDLKKGERIRTLTGFREPQGVLYIPESNKLFVTNGGDGTIKVLNGTTLEPLMDLRPFQDADNIRYDPLKQSVYVGYGEGGIAILEAEHASSQGSIGLKGHPEAFELERSGPRIFVNVPSIRQIVVVDRNKHSIVATWQTMEAQANFPMALDEIHHRLFVGFRKPARLIVFDTESGKEVVSLVTHKDPDDIFYDPTHQIIFISCGEGFLDVLKQKDADHYNLIEETLTAPGTRTALFVPEQGRLYLAVPRQSHEGAELRVYDVKS
jgi:WD40 repeat protein